MKGKKNEIWKRLPEDEDYIISNYGRIWSFKYDKRNGKEVKPYFANGFAFYRINARTNPKSINITYTVARLFVPNDNPKHTRVIHIDGNTRNNHYKNLKWATHKQATAISYRKRKMTLLKQRKERLVTHSKLKVSDVAHIKSLLLRDIPLRKIAMMYNISDMQVHRIKVGENWKDVEPMKLW